jgi:integrase
VTAARRPKGRGNGEGSIYQRSDGKWCAAITLDGGKRKVLYGRTRKDVGDKLATVLPDVKRGLPVPGLRLTTAKFFSEWLENTVKPSRRVGTYRLYETYVRTHIVPAIGSVPIAKLGPLHIQRFQRDLKAKGLAESTTMVVRAVLSAGLTQAEKWGLMARNPVRLVEAPRQTQKEPGVLTPEQAAAILLAVRGQEFHHLFPVMLATGLRLGEALGLRWQDVNLDGQQLQVRNQMLEVTGKGRYLSEPKSQHGRRTIPLIPAAVASLRAQHARMLERRMHAAALWHEQDLVFIDELGEPIVARRAQRSFNRALKSAGLPTTYTPHSLRHSAATYLLAAGVPDRVVMEILGHGSTAMTTHYEHVMSTMLTDAADRLARIFPAAAS